MQAVQASSRSSLRRRISEKRYRKWFVNESYPGVRRGRRRRRAGEPSLAARVRCCAADGLHPMVENPSGFICGVCRLDIKDLGAAGAQTQLEPKNQIGQLFGRQPDDAVGSGGT